MIENIVKINGYTFTFTPSLRCLAVKSPTGGLEIIHVGVRNTRKQESEAANEIAMNILYRQDVTKAGLTTNPLATHDIEVFPELRCLSSLSSRVREKRKL